MQTNLTLRVRESNVQSKRLGILFTGLVPLTNRVMRIGVAEFFVANIPDEDPEDDECVYAKHGTLEGVTQSRDMHTIHAQVEEVQVNVL